MLIVIVGIDGSGKTTQAKLLEERLKNEVCDCLYLNPVYFLYNFVTKHSKSENLAISPREVRVHKTNSYYDQLTKLAIMPLGYIYAFASIFFISIRYRKKLVICDRFFYQFFYDLYGTLAEKLLKFFPRPDITIYLNGNLETFYSRMDSFDVKVEKEYYIGMMDLFDKLAETHEFILVNALLEKEKISEIVYQEIKRRLVTYKGEIL